MMTKPSILLGGNGFLARHIVAAAPPERPWRIYSRRRPDYPFEGEWRPLAYPDELPSLAELLGSSRIYYALAAGVQPGHSDSEALQWGLNAFYPMQLLQGLAEAAYTGTWLSFGSYFEWGQAPLPQASNGLSEAELWGHNNPYPNVYCRSKSLLSRHLAAAQQTEAYAFTWRHFILSNVYGRGEQAKRLLPYIVGQLQAGQALQFTAGTQRRQYSQVADIAAYLLQTEGSPLRGIFNLGLGQVYSVREVVAQALAIAQEKGFSPPEPAFGQAQRGDTAMPHLALDDSRTYALLGEPASMRSLRQGIEAYFD